MIFEDNGVAHILDSVQDGICLIDRHRSITYWNKGAEKLTGHSMAEAVGKKCSDILRHIDMEGKDLCDSMCPAIAVMADGRSRESMQYALHKEGFRLPVAVRVLPTWNAEGVVDGAAVILGDVTPRFTQIRRIEEAQKILRSVPAADLDIKREIEINLHLRFDEMQRYSWPFGVIFFEVDGLREIIERHGPKEGQRVLRMVAQTIIAGIRSSDTIGRWGEETFLVVLGNVNEHQLNSAASRIRMLVEKSAIYRKQGPLSTTVSIGATVAKPSDTGYTLLKRAEDLMRQSARGGRNRITIDAEE